MTDFLATKPAGHSGMGTTLSANALAIAALTANLEHVMTDSAYAHMLQLAERLAEGLNACIVRRRLPWSIVSVGARTELTFAPAPAVTARQSLAAADPLLERTIHLYLLNRGVLITPFHNMMLVSPATTEDQVQQLLRAFEECCEELWEARLDSTSRPGFYFQSSGEHDVCVHRLVTTTLLIRLQRARRISNEGRD